LNLAFPDLDPVLTDDTTASAFDSSSSNAAYALYVREQEEALNRWSSAQFTYDLPDSLGRDAFKASYSAKDAPAVPSDAGLGRSSFSEAMHGTKAARLTSTTGSSEEEQQQHRHHQSVFLGDLAELLAGPVSPIVSSSAILSTLAPAAASSLTIDPVVLDDEHPKELVGGEDNSTAAAPRGHVLPVMVNMRHIRGKTLFPAAGKTAPAAAALGKRASSDLGDMSQLVVLEEERKGKTKKARATAPRKKAAPSKSKDEEAGDDEDVEENQSQLEKEAAEAEKRRRNTAASARFRIKKKIKEQAMERAANEMTAKAQILEARVHELEMEVRWLRGLLLEKDPRLLDMASKISHDRDLAS